MWRLPMGVGFRMRPSLYHACDLPPRARRPPWASSRPVFEHIASRSGYTYSTGIVPMMKAKSTAFDSLNPSQRRAATFGTAVADQGVQGVNAGPLLILAGAGTGKTN